MLYKLILGKEVTYGTVHVSSYDFTGSDIVDGYYTQEQSGLLEHDSLMVLYQQQDQ